MDLTYVIASAENTRALVLWHKLQVETLALHWYAFLCDQEQEEERQKQLQKCKKPRKKRSCWTRDWVQRRKQFGQWENLLQELILEDKTSYRNFLRMDETTFTEILERIRPRIEKQHTFWREPLEPGLRLSITLRYLATGDSYRSLSYGFRVPHNTISGIVYETCEAIVAEYLDEVLVCPTTEDGWREVAQGFSSRWNFQHTIGAIDGKHVAIRAPNKSGSFYFNYKGFHSLVLLAVVDSDCKFIYANVGANGASCDAQVFNLSTMKRAFDQKTLHLPPSEPIEGDDHPLPYFMVGDEAFALQSWLMKPFPHRGLTRKERIFNYRLSRARRVVENAFGILANRYVV